MHPAHQKAPSADWGRELELFALVADNGSFSAAARKLGIAPSSVSRVVDHMEERLGVRLLLRTTRSLTLTPEGSSYLSAARRILADVRETEQLISHQSSPKGRLRVSASIEYGRMFLLPVLGGFIQRYPDILLDVSLTDTVVDIAAGQADVGIRVGPLADTQLVARKLAETRKVIVASPDYLARRGAPETPGDLHAHDCLGFNFKRTAPVWPFLSEGRHYALAIKGSVEADNGDTLRQLAIGGVGITRIGTITVEDEIRSGALIPLLEEFNPGDVEEVHALFVGGPHIPARVRCFLDYLTETLRP